MGDMGDLVTWPMVAMALIGFLTTAVTSTLAWLKSRENGERGKSLCDLAEQSLAATEKGNKQLAQVAQVQQVQNGGPNLEKIKLVAAETAISTAAELGREIITKLDENHALLVKALSERFPRAAAPSPGESEKLEVTAPIELTVHAPETP